MCSAVDDKDDVLSIFSSDSAPDDAQPSTKSKIKGQSAALQTRAHNHTRNLRDVTETEGSQSIIFDPLQTKSLFEKLRRPLLQPGVCAVRHIPAPLTPVTTLRSRFPQVHAAHLAQGGFAG